MKNQVASGTQTGMALLNREQTVVIWRIGSPENPVTSYPKELQREGHTAARGRGRRQGLGRRRQEIWGEGRHSGQEPVSKV